MYPRIGACQNIFLITNVFYYSYLIQSKSCEKIEQNMQVQRSLKYIFLGFRTKSGKCTKVQEHFRPKSLLSVLCAIQTSHKQKVVKRLKHFFVFLRRAIIYIYIYKYIYIEILLIALALGRIKKTKNVSIVSQLFVYARFEQYIILITKIWV